MFVFKAAVVGAGTMGGEIAQAIAAADIPVVLKDIDQKFVDAGLDKAREVTRGQLDRLVKKEKLTAEQAEERLEQVIGCLRIAWAKLNAAVTTSGSVSGPSMISTSGITDAG